MARDMCADVKMEEGYMRMSIEYNNDESRTKIQDAIGVVEKRMGIYPDVLRRAISNEAGNYSVEFGYDSCQRTAGEFCEEVMKELGIDHCSI
ncbi:MAG: hypothetical protein IE909_10160 [Campylobacterales bacterium]|nr:hypothetical protein [Campylobacterales bacterium]